MEILFQKYYVTQEIKNNSSRINNIPGIIKVIPIFLHTVSSSRETQSIDSGIVILGQSLIYLIRFND